MRRHAGYEAITHTQSGRRSKEKKEKTYHCDCGKAFAQDVDLRRHKDHFPDDLLICKFPGCMRKYHRLDNLQLHQSRAHESIEDWKDSTRPFLIPRMDAARIAPTLAPQYLSTPLGLKRPSFAFSNLGDPSVEQPNKEPHKSPLTPSSVDVISDGKIKDSSSSKINEVIDSYLDELVQDIEKALLSASLLDASRTFDSSNMGMAFSHFLDLLKSFAQRTGRDGPVSLSRRAEMFMSIHRETILAKLRDNMLRQENESLPEARYDEPSQALDLRIKRWLEELPQSQDGDDHDKVSDLPEQDSEKSIAQELGKYRNLIIGVSATHTWMHPKVERLFSLSLTANTDRLPRISDTILNTFLSIQKARRQPNEKLCTMLFRIDWNPLAFLRDQEYADNILPENALEDALTITGDGTDAQAMTTSQYMDQTWSLAGQEILSFLKDLIRVGYRTPYDRALKHNPGISTIHGFAAPDALRISVHGPIDSIAELGEQISWLGSALRSSPEEEGVAYCYPAVSIVKPQLENSGRPWFVCEIDFNYRIRNSKSKLAELPLRHEGQCWHGLFQNPVVVLGYPTRNRPMEEIGLEMSIEMMAELIGCDRITTFDGKFYIKNFNRMLVLAKRIEDVLIWHFICNDDGSYISYTDSRAHSISSLGADNIEMSTLESARHVVGWCSHVRSYAGRTEAEYKIGWSRLKRAHSKCAFEKVSISAGKFISGGASLAIGKRDKPVWITLQDDYISKLEWISSQFVVFYDLQDERAWLLDGLSALLHLVRASLHHSVNNKFAKLLGRTAPTLDEGEPNEDTQLAAMALLVNDANLKQKLHPNPEDQWEEESIKSSKDTERVTKRQRTYFSFKDKVLRIHHALEQIITHQCNVNSEDGVGFRIKGTPRKQLEGFNFMDIATDAAPCWPLVTTVKGTGRGWVDFTRAIHAITLFGRGFGDILRPSDPTRLCSLWTSVPKHQDYLAVCCSDLERIFEKYGDRNNEPRRLVDDIYWVRRDKTFEDCQCGVGTPKKQSCDRVQLFLPSISFNRKFWGKQLQSSYRIEEKGAIILGHNWKLPLRWGAEGDPEEGDPECSDEEASPSMNEVASPQLHSTRSLQSSGNGSASNIVISSDDDFSTNNTEPSSRTPQSNRTYPIRIKRPSSLPALKDAHLSSPGDNDSSPDLKRKIEILQDGIGRLFKKRP